MPLTPARIATLRDTYREGLLSDTVPFWFPRSIDHDHGGYLLIRDRDGSRMDDDKAIWHQGRSAWLLATLFAEVEQREEWLDWARHGIEFLRAHGFDTDGKMLFHVTRDGRPVRKRRYIFSETFMIAALAAYTRAARIAGRADEANRALEEAEELFAHVKEILATPGAIDPKFYDDTRPAKGLAIPMIMIVTAQLLRKVAADPAPYTDAITGWINEITTDFMQSEREVVMETVAPDGSIIDHMDWRTITPGHSIEAAWFIMQEARERGGDKKLLETGTTILDWMWKWGWDEEYGGLLYFVDVTGRPVQEYWQDMKFWWPHNEAIIASLMAYRMTGEERYAEMHTAVHDWAYRHFPDHKHGEWFGYLHRDGRISVPLKGNLWKGPFHLPRMQLVCWQLCEEMLGIDE